MTLDEFAALSLEDQRRVLRHAPKMVAGPMGEQPVSILFLSADEAYDYALAFGTDSARLTEIHLSVLERVKAMREIHAKAKKAGVAAVVDVNTEIEDFDYSGLKPVPGWIREVIETHLAIEAEDAKKAGALGFMTRAMVLASMPYKDPKTDSFTRRNGQFTLRIVAGYEGGIPYGIYPRLLMSWLTTEAVRTQSPTIELGDSLGRFLSDVLDVRSKSGGRRGGRTLVAEQMKRLFGAFITAQAKTDDRKFRLRGIQIVEDLELDEEALWTPQARHEAGQWKSKLRLTNRFFQELISSPVPIDLRAYKALRGSPMAMDLYTWLTYRMSYLRRPTTAIPWEVLAMQFGAGFGGGNLTQQAVRDFKKGFKTALEAVSLIYPGAEVEVNDAGVILLPSAPHINPRQKSLFETR